MRLLVFIFVMLVPISVSVSVSAAEFELLAEIDVGGAPHGMRVFDGKLYLAAAGDDAIEIIDLESLAIVGRWTVPGTPLDLVRAGDGWLVSTFRDEELIYVDGETGALGAHYNVGAGPSLFIPDDQAAGRNFVVSEFADRLTIVDIESAEIVGSFATGDRPYPGDMTRDGVLAFVPNRDEGTVSVIDMLNQKELARVEVCAQPQGGMLTRDQVSFMVTCSVDNRVALINTASFEVTGTIAEGIGERPFSVAMSTDGRFAFVNNAGGTDVSVIDVALGRVTNRLPAGDKPIVLRVFDNILYVASEDSNTLSIYRLPIEPAPVVSGAKNDLLVMGMIHSGHVTSDYYSLAAIRSVIETYNPDYVLTEIAPNRMQAAMEGFKRDGIVTENRVVRFPEYRDVLFALSRHMDFEIIPTAAWNRPMSDYRNQIMSTLGDDPEWEDAFRMDRIKQQAMNRAFSGHSDDPYFIHSDAYDEGTREGLSAYSEFLNDVIGPGGWENINNAHYALIKAALDAHSGEGARILIMFGAGHKYWFLDHLKERSDINLVDMQGVLAEAGIERR
jgi:DNA-binding beta-propeller fold protein YncE